MKKAVQKVRHRPIVHLKSCGADSKAKALVRSLTLVKVYVHTFGKIWFLACGGVAYVNK